MVEREVTLEELVGWLEINGVSHEIDASGKLTVKGDLAGRFGNWIASCEYTSLPDELFCVEGGLWLEGTSITSLGGLTSVRGDFDLQNTSITSLGNLDSVEGNLSLQGTPVTSLGNLTSVEESLFLRGASITSLCNLTSVRGSLFLLGTPVTSLDDLPQVGGYLFLDSSLIRLLTRGVSQKAEKGIICWKASENNRILLSPSELEAIIAENEARDSLRNTRETGVDWDLYDR